MQIVDISGNGGKVAFLTSAKLAAGDFNNDYDIYVRDLNAGVTRLASSDEFGAAMGVPERFDASTDFDEHASQKFDMSASGRYLAFTSASPAGEADADADVFLRDAQLGRTLLVTEGFDGPSFDPGISGAGDVIVFETRSALVAGDDDADLVDVYAAFIDLESFSVTGYRLLSGGAGLPDGFDFIDPVLSPDGGTVAFQSFDPDFTDPGGLFRRRLDGGPATRVDGFVPDSSGDTSSTTGYALGEHGESLVARTLRPDRDAGGILSDDMELFLL